MVKRCSVCSHPARPEIDRALIARVPLRTLAVAHGLSPSALHRHTRHLAQALAAQERRQDEAHLTGLLDKLDLLEARLDRLFRATEAANSYHIALGCLQETLRLLALQERLRQSQAPPRAVTGALP